MTEKMTNQATVANRGAMAERSLVALAQRWIVTLHMAALAAQVAFALLLLAGISGMLQLHSANAWVVLALGLLQAVTIMPGWPSGSSLWKLAAGLVVLAEVAQIQLGRGASLPAHVTLGTVLWGLSLALLIQVWAPSWGRQSRGTAS